MTKTVEEIVDEREMEAAENMLTNKLPAGAFGLVGTTIGRNMTQEEKEAYEKKFKRLQEARTVLLRRYPDLVVSINSYGNRLTIELSAVATL